ncbi:hypothetical protein CMV03_06965 [Elizabethkingia anophelis]|nr:hypothetical protein [Elizabethkingia anophelis]
MALEPKHRMSDIDRVFKAASENVTNSFLRVLRYVGERAVNEARLNGNYLDRTANLRNSIGYVIVVNGRILDVNFQNTAAQTQTSTEDGLKIGKDLALELASRQSEIALIVVAGMKYALYVESTGKNVLTSAEQMANTQVPLLLRQLL